MGVIYFDNVFVIFAHPYPGHRAVPTCTPCRDGCTAACVCARLRLRGAITHGADLLFGSASTQGDRGVAIRVFEHVPVERHCLPAGFRRPAASRMCNFARYDLKERPCVLGRVACFVTHNSGKLSPMRRLSLRLCSQHLPPGMYVCGDMAILGPVPCRGFIGWFGAHIGNEE